MTPKLSERQEKPVATFRPTCRNPLLTPAEALWRLHRARCVEACPDHIAMHLTDGELSDGGTIENLPTEAPLGPCFFDPDQPQAFASLHRYVEAADRTYRQALPALRKVISRRPTVVPGEPVVAVPVTTAKPKTAAAGQPLPPYDPADFAPLFALGHPTRKPGSLEVSLPGAQRL